MYSLSFVEEQEAIVKYDAAFKGSEIFIILYEGDSSSIISIWYNIMKCWGLLFFVISSIKIL